MAVGEKVTSFAGEGKSFVRNGRQPRRLSLTLLGLNKFYRCGRSCVTDDPSKHGEDSAGERDIHVDGPQESLLRIAVTYDIPRGRMYASSWGY